MVKTNPDASWQTSLVLLAGTVIGVVAVLALYWVQIVFMPLALAAYLTFLLTPGVRSLQRRGLGRVPSVLLVVLIGGLLVAGLGWLITRQLGNLLTELPNYTANMKEKARALRELGDGQTTIRLKWMVEEISAALHAQPVPEDAGPSKPPLPNPATEQSQFWLPRLPFYLGSVFEAGTGLVLTFVLLLFMLLDREDLRNRLIRLIGHGRLTYTTRAVDDAAHRISRYLLMQALINGAYGLVWSAGLFIIGIDYALLWGFLAAILRYVPYVGVWGAIVFPATLSLAMFQDWWHPLGVLGFFLALELIVSNWVEPRLFGQSIGVSEVALLSVAAFWAFLWGPVGLVLSAPLTVCLTVLGKYVPQLSFLDVMLGDEPVLPPDVAIYQRLLAHDQDEALELVRAEIKEKSEESIHDAVLLPVLIHARRDYERDELSEPDLAFLCQAMREILAELPHRAAAEPAPGEADARQAPASKPLRILACPARDELDGVSLELLQQILDPAHGQMEIGGTEKLAAELTAKVAEEGIAVVCIGSLAPGGMAHTRYLAKRLRAASPQLRIAVGRWGLAAGSVEQNKKQVSEAGADAMVTTLHEMRTTLNDWTTIVKNERAHEIVDRRLQMAD